MNRWKNMQEALIASSIKSEKNEISKEKISKGRVQGTLFYKKNFKYKKGILLIHGMSGNRLGLSPLAERLADYGYFCLSLDLPSHFENKNDFSMGELCETINEGLLFIKNLGIERISLIGHSVGAVGSIFANMGYNITIEKNIYSNWEKIKLLLDSLSKKSDYNEFKKILNEVEKSYLEIKQIIFNSLKQKHQQKVDIDCLILLAPPINCKSAIPALSLLNKLNHKWIKTIFEKLFHEPAVKQTNKEGNPAGFTYENKPDTIYWQFFKTKESKEFLNYFLNMKEPKDFIKLIEDLSKFKHIENKINFFEYYQKKYLFAKPKLFIYGKKDLYLKPFLPFARKRLEKFYEGCGNAEIYYGDFTHIMMNDPNQQLGILAVNSDKVTEKIMNFLDRH
ncbi:MAG: hypothetical protein PHU51_03055 [Candidatus Nanoarchaeia archaeon]|nr:hypothetical protein [Candidatus Nanoarchaeia archaeon]